MTGRSQIRWGRPVIIYEGVLMRDFIRERATEIADLPHEFAGVENAGACLTCRAALGDPRHVAWERAELASRERAQEEVKREFGS